MLLEKNPDSLIRIQFCSSSVWPHLNAVLHCQVRAIHGSHLCHHIFLFPLQSIQILLLNFPKCGISLHIFWSCHSLKALSTCFKAIATFFNPSHLSHTLFPWLCLFHHLIEKELFLPLCSYITLIYTPIMT